MGALAALLALWGAWGAWEAAAVPVGSALDTFAGLAGHKDLTPQYTLGWEASGDSITIGIRLSLGEGFPYDRNGGVWVGFGVADKYSYSMLGGDIALAWSSGADEIGFGDYHALDFVMPVLDELQDWTLDATFRDSDEAVFILSRVLDTGDCQDRPIVQGFTPLIFAFGRMDPSGRIMPHQPCCVGAIGLDMLPRHLRAAGEDASGDSSETDADTREKMPTGENEGRSHEDEDEDEEVMTLDLLMPGYLVPALATSFACYSLPVPVNFTEEYHIVKMEPLMDSGLMHHNLVYSCSRMSTENVVPYGCQHCLRYCNLFYTTASGSAPTVLPKEAGLRMGKDGVQLVTFSMHYANPEGLTGVIDRSGVRLTYTKKLRANDAGIVTMGDHFLRLRPYVLIPPGKPDYTVHLICPSECTERFSHDITLFGVLPHQHMLGVRSYAHLWREHKFEAEIARVDFFDFARQSLGLIEPVVIKPGDEIDLQFVFDSTSRTTPTMIADDSEEEMTIYYFLYYPLATVGPDDSPLQQCVIEYDNLYRCGQQREKPSLDSIVHHPYRKADRRVPDTPSFGTSGRECSNEVHRIYHEAFNKHCRDFNCAMVQSCSLVDFDHQNPPSDVIRPDTFGSRRGRYYGEGDESSDADDADDGAYGDERGGGPHKPVQSKAPKLHKTPCDYLPLSYVLKDFIFQGEKVLLLSPNGYHGKPSIYFLMGRHGLRQPDFIAWHDLLECDPGTATARFYSSKIYIDCVREGTWLYKIVLTLPPPEIMFGEGHTIGVEDDDDIEEDDSDDDANQPTQKPGSLICASEMGSWLTEDEFLFDLEDEDVLTPVPTMHPFVDKALYTNMLEIPVDEHTTMKILWRLLNESMIEIAVEARTSGYIGIGFSDTGTMEDADIVIGQLHADGTVTVVDYYSDANADTPKRDTLFGGVGNIVEFTGFEVDDVSTLKFVRPLEGDQWDYTITDKPIQLIWALGYHDALAYHRVRGTVEVTMLGEHASNLYDHIEIHDDVDVSYYDRESTIPDPAAAGDGSEGAAHSQDNAPPATDVGGGGTVGFVLSLIAACIGIVLILVFFGKQTPGDPHTVLPREIAALLPKFD